MRSLQQDLEPDQRGHGWRLPTPKRSTDFVARGVGAYLLVGAFAHSLFAEQWQVVLTTESTEEPPERAATEQLPPPVWRTLGLGGSGT